MFAMAELCGFVAWRTPAAVNWLAGAPGASFVEAVVLVPVGVGLWLEIVESPPLSPARRTRCAWRSRRQRCGRSGCSLIW